MPKTAKPKKHHKRGSSVKKNLLFLCGCCAVVVILALTSINLVPALQRSVLGASTESEPTAQQTTLQEIAFWQDFVAKNPDYFDGWIELATLELDIGDKKGAAQDLEKARNIFPNSEKVRQLENLLNE